MRPLHNVELAEEAKKHPLFADISNAALRKDITRFVKREIGRTIERVDGRLGLIFEPSSTQRGYRHLAYDLLHVQTDIRDKMTEKVVHDFSYSVIRNVSADPITSFKYSFISELPQSWEDRNPIIDVVQDKSIRHYDKVNKPRFRPLSTRTQMKFYIDLPKKLYPNHTFTLKITRDSKDKNPTSEDSIILPDLTLTKELIFDLIKAKTDTESLDCTIHRLDVEESVASAAPSQGQTVIDLKSGKRVYALRWAMKNPELGGDYEFVYRN